MSEHAVSTINCKAFGCPLQGTMSTSTSGTSEWLCFVHFGLEADQWQSATVELNRMKWLVDLTRTIRENALSNPQGWNTIEAGVHKEMTMAQRSDLHRKPPSAAFFGNAEPVNRWLARLESVLRDAAVQGA